MLVRCMRGWVVGCTAASKDCSGMSGSIPCEPAGACANLTTLTNVSPPPALQAWSTPHLPSRKNAYGRTLRVHAGFYRAWRTADLGDRLVSRLAQLLEDCPLGVRPRVLFTGGTPYRAHATDEGPWGRRLPRAALRTCPLRSWALDRVACPRTRYWAAPPQNACQLYPPLPQATAWAARWRCWPPLSSCGERPGTPRGSRCTPLAPPG